MKMKPICVIPARAGSKRVPGKNMRLLGGEPLVQWITEAALQADIFEKVYISTDAPEMLESQWVDATYDMWRWEFEILKRPPELSGDDVRAEEVFKYVVEGLSEDRPDIVCMAMPTAPFTSPESLRNAYRLMVNCDYDGVFLAVRTPFKTQRTVELTDEGVVVPVSRSWLDMDKQSQDLNPTYRPTYGGMFIKTGELLATTGYYAPHNQGMYEVEHPEGIDIDTEKDFAKAELIVADRCVRKLLEKEPVRREDGLRRMHRPERQQRRLGRYAGIRSVLLGLWTRTQDCAGSVLRFLLRY